jgi:glycosyltransferase involved in cell wall biosynthesis
VTKRLHIIYWENGKGLQCDAGILAGIAESAGYEVSFSETKNPGHYGKLFSDHVATRWHNWRLRRNLLRQARMSLSATNRLPYDVAICLEDVTSAAFEIARKTVLIPNQEWFKKSHVGKIPDFDAVLCKSRLAETIFEAAGAHVRYIGFSTRVPTAERGGNPDFSRCLHIAGRSFMKGTRAVVEAWGRHPEWPILTVLGTGGHALEGLPSNVRLIDRYMSQEERQHLQTTHGIHVCPSESEGYGHTIAEGMAMGAVVVTTNAPPMNELIGRDRGFLVSASRQKPMGLDHCYNVSVRDLETAIEELLTTSLEERARLGREAKRHFAQSNKFFHSAFLESLNELAGIDP